jgi:hypothetical protein
VQKGTTSEEKKKTPIRIKLPGCQGKSRCRKKNALGWKKKKRPRYHEITHREINAPYQFNAPFTKGNPTAEKEKKKMPV